MKTPDQTKIRGMKTFTIIWAGQFVSLIGTQMTAFAITIWAFKITGRATELSLVAFFYMAPLVLLSPISGVLVDRGNRKTILIISDLGAGLATIIILLLYYTGYLQVWHLFVTAAIEGIFQSFQWPAYSAAISLMIPKEKYAQADGMMSLARGGSGVFAPLLAGGLLPIIGFQGVLSLDVITFILAISTLLFSFVPEPVKNKRTGEPMPGFLKEALFGFQYIFARPGLLGLQMVFFGSNFLATLAFTLLAPMVLARTNQNEMVFSFVQASGAFGGIVGGIVMSARGGPRRLIHGVLGGWILTSIFGTSLIGLGHALPVWAIGMFFAALFTPIVNGSNQAIWQAKVTPDVQGRVFAIRRMIAIATNPIAALIAGPLADRVLEPAMGVGRSLTGWFSWMVGAGPGAGMALMFVFAGIGTTMIAFAGYSVKNLRDVETLIPDHEQRIRND